MRPSSINCRAKAMAGTHLAALPRRRRHLLGLSAIHGQRLFARDNFARLKRGDGDIVMSVVGRADIDNLDFGIVDNAPPVLHRIFPSPALGHLLHFGLVAAANGFQPWRQGQVEKLADLPVRVRMGLAHELVTDHADGDALAHIAWLEGNLWCAFLNTPFRVADATAPCARALI